MRIRIDSDNAKKVNAARKKNGAEGKPLSAHQEVNKALASHYATEETIRRMKSK